MQGNRPFKPLLAIVLGLVLVSSSIARLYFIGAIMVVVSICYLICGAVMDAVKYEMQAKFVLAGFYFLVGLVFAYYISVSAPRDKRKTSYIPSNSKYDSFEYRVFSSLKRNRLAEESVAI